MINALCKVHAIVRTCEYACRQLAVREAPTRQSSGVTLSDVLQSLELLFLSPLVVHAAGGLLLPETPNSLVERGHLEEAQRVLRKLRGTENIQVEYEDIVMATQQAQQARTLSAVICMPSFPLT